MRTLELWVVVLFIWLVNICVPVQSAAVRADHNLQKRATRKCGSHGTSSCEDHKCENGKCKTACDAMSLGPNGETYKCVCDTGYFGTFCGASSKSKCMKCEEGEYCYTSDSMVTGYICFDKKWKVSNKEDSYKKHL